MAGTAPKRIMLESRNFPIMVKEAVAGEAGIGPGDLLEYSTSVGTVLRHNGSGAEVIPTMVALEKWWNDEDSAFALDVDYANGDVVRYGIPLPGDVVYMWLASGQNAAALALLTSDGDGALEVETAITDADVVHSIVGIAVEASDASAALKRVKVLIV